MLDLEKQARTVDVEAELETLPDEVILLRSSCNRTFARAGKRAAVYLVTGQPGHQHPDLYVIQTFPK